MRNQFRAVVLPPLHHDTTVLEAFCCQCVCVVFHDDYNHKHRFLAQNKLADTSLLVQCLIFTIFMSCPGNAAADNKLLIKAVLV